MGLVTDLEPPNEAALREKYKFERDKRLRPDGNDQYIEPVGRYAHFREDPYTERVERDPVVRDVEVAIIGAGFAGLNMGARLREVGVDDVWLIDPAGDVGGAWYWNRYPGAMCDTAAMIYLPLLEETNYQPSAKYTLAPEIFAHAQRIARTFGLYEHALFSTEVTDVTWDDDASRWVVTTDRGDTLRARFVATGTGPLNRPKLPGIPGIESFEGHAFHTSRWDYDYTGGSAEGAPMTNLADKRVGIIGTGATAVQCIPALARDSGELFVFQRTPSSIDVRGNRPIDPEWFGTLEPGWQRKWQMNFCVLQTGGFADEDLVQDGWTDISQRIRDKVVERLSGFSELDPEVMRKAYEESDDEKMAEIRARVDEVVADEATAQALKPWYRQLCKRPCFHDEYLLAYNVPTCHLVDTNGQGVERIDATGVWVGGQHYELDCLVFASGFEVGTEIARRQGYETTGRDGITLTQYWTEGMRTLHGNFVHNFPNYFILGFAQGANLLSNVTHNLSDCAISIAKVVEYARASGHTVVEPSDVAEKEWVDLVMSGDRRTIFGDPDCTPGYYNNEGQPLDTAYNFAAAGYPAGPAAYFEYAEAWRNTGEFAGLTFSRPNA